MRIATWNMNGYSARVKDGSLKALLAERYDVVCLQETKIARRVLRSFVARLMATGKPVVLCGDLNVTAADVDCHQAPLYAGTPNHTDREREAFRSLLGLGLADVWREQHPGVLRCSWMPAVATPLAVHRETRSGFRFDYVLASAGTGFVSSDILVAHPRLRPRTRGRRTQVPLIQEAKGFDQHGPRGDAEGRHISGSPGGHRK